MQRGAPPHVRPNSLWGVFDGRWLGALHEGYGRAAEEFAASDAAQELADNMVGPLLHERCVGIGATLARSELCLRSRTSAHERVHCMSR